MSKPTGASPSPSLVGAWHLKSVGGKDPTTISIKSWQIEFREQGNWVYSGAMTGEYEGTKLSGSGTWLLKGSELDYTAGSNKGRRSLTRSGDSLKWKRTGRDSIRKAGVALAEACAVCSPKSGSVSAMGIFCQLTNACLWEVALCRRASKFRAGSRCDGELICGYVSGVRAPGLMVGNGADSSSSIGG